MSPSVNNFFQMFERSLDLKLIQEGHQNFPMFAIKLTFLI